jgi:CheY-like chemotaxis protein
LTLNENKEIPNKYLKVLVVEDDDFSYLLAYTILKKIGHHVLHAKNGLEALNTIKMNPDIDLILMDIKMPEMNGYEATGEIRKINKDIIIVALTAFALIDDRKKALSSGCNDYLSKPIIKNEILSIIQKYF